MTSPRRFEQDLPALLADLYAAGTPDYRDDLLRSTAATRQRPAWSFPTRWLPMDLTMRRLPTASAPWRVLGVALLIALMLATMLLLVVGSPRHVPPPFGPARNGGIIYAQGGSILVQDTPGAAAHVLVSGAVGVENHFPTYSPDGRRFVFAQKDYLMVAMADGSAAHRIFDQALDADAFSAWAPDSLTIALTTHAGMTRQLLLIHVNGESPTAIDLGGIVPVDVLYRPPDGRQLLIRGWDSTGAVDLYLYDIASATLRPLGLPSHPAFGTKYDNSGPTWSLDGNRIAYNAPEERDAAIGVFRIHVVDFDGRNDRALPAPTDPLVQEGWPAFSPDGRSILAHRWTWNPGGEGWVAVMPADGSAPSRDVGPHFPGGQDTGIAKTWSPDGSRVIVHLDNAPEIWSIDPITSEATGLPMSGADMPDIQRLAP